jgi:hypothetical protein
VDATPAPTLPAQLDVFLTGDNHFLGSSLPIGSEPSIAAAFDLFRNANHARRIAWRGLEETTWIANMHSTARRTASFQAAGDANDHGKRGTLSNLLRIGRTSHQITAL